MTDALPILYSFRRCPYAMRARMAISVSDYKCALREVVLRDKPAAMLKASPKGTVPVLVLPDGRVLEESREIMEFCLTVADPERWMADGDIAAMAALVDRCDTDFKANLDRYKYPTRYENVVAEDHRAAGLKFLEELEARLDGQPYLFGETRTYADVAIFPFVRQFANTDRAWFDAQPIPQVRRWMDGLINSDLFTSVMAKYGQWQPGNSEPLFPA